MATRTRKRFKRSNLTAEQDTTLVQTSIHPEIPGKEDISNLIRTKNMAALLVTTLNRSKIEHFPHTR